MSSVTTDLKARLIKVLNSSTTPRIAVLVAVVALGAIVGPPGLAVGPIQSRTNTPALPTGAAMEARAVLSTIPISFDLIQIFSNLVQDHASYPVRTVGPLSFPDGAINVPWTDVARAGQAYSSAAGERRGSTISAPRGNNLPQLFRTTDVSGAANRATSHNIALTNSLRSVILFDRAGSDLGGEAANMLDRIAVSLNNNSARIQLRAFGGGIAERSHSARRLALRRALAVRNYLMEQGVSQERITVRAMGGAADGGPSDRVDIVFPAP